MMGEKNTVQQHSVPLLMLCNFYIQWHIELQNLYPVKNLLKIFCLLSLAEWGFTFKKAVSPLY